jgi:hypothetical protein
VNREAGRTKEVPGEWKHPSGFRRSLALDLRIWNLGHGKKGLNPMAAE